MTLSSLGDDTSILDVTTPNSPAQIQQGQALTTTFEDSVISGLGFTIGGVVFGLMLVWLGGSSLGKKVKRVAGYG